MRLGFIGRSGHHYLKTLVDDPFKVSEYSVAFAPDPFDADDGSTLPGWMMPESQAFATTQKMFEEFAPEVVSIGVRYGHNGDVAAMALESGVAVVCEKPVAATWEQLDKLRALTQESNLALLTEFPFRSQRAFRAARNVVRDGKIGEVLLASAQKSYRFGDSRPAWYSERSEYAGTLLWVASHGIDAVRFCTGQKLGRVTGVQGNLSKPGYGTMEDFCVALFELENGGAAVVHADYSRPVGAPTHGDDRLRIAGSEGVVEVRDERCILLSGEEPPRDITKSVAESTPSQELLSALRGQCDEYYSTAASLEIAEVLLRARDAADARQWID